MVPERNSLIRKPYDNFKIFHPNGTHMCFCSEKKALWYIERGLAVPLDNNSIQLIFQPKGLGDPMEILVGRHNGCVITGDNKNLTKHHVIPYQYRKHFDGMYKDKNSGDLVVLTRKKHNEYESIATEFKNVLYYDFIDKQTIEYMTAWKYAKSLYNTLNIHTSKIPASIQVFMQMKLEGLKDNYRFTDVMLQKTHREWQEEHDINRMIVDKVGTINLIVLWKHHFIKYGKPKFLPSWWKPTLVKVINKKQKNKQKTELINIDTHADDFLHGMMLKYGLYE